MALAKTATVTWVTYENCGTYLQAYALQHVLFGLHYDNKILDDRQIVEGLQKKLVWPLELVRSAKRYLSQRRSGPYRRRVGQSYSRFRAAYLQIDHDVADLQQVSRRYDVFLSGSDQIWSSILPVVPYYYLSFTDKKKVSYASSLSKFPVSQSWLDAASPLIRRFAHCSSREAPGSSVLSAISGREAPCVLDPTLLLDAASWQPLCAERPLPEGQAYVFCYLLTPNAAYLQCARQYAHSRGAQLVLMGTNPKYAREAGHVLWGGPSEFLAAIRGAEAVLTDSFHATIFSILHHKEFYTFQRFSEGSPQNQNSRLQDLFARLGIEGRFVAGQPGASVPPLCWAQIEARLAAGREASMAYLKNALAN